jgi:phosphate transport system substrate-binding protein
MQRAAWFLFILGPAVLLLFSKPGMVPEAQAQAGWEDSLAIIVNQSNPVENLSAADLRKIFMGERTHWQNGRRITLVMLESGPERKVVLREICHMGETDFNNHFIQGLFTGQVLVSPKILATPIDVRKFVFNVPGAIGYVRASEVDASVKTVRIDGRVPADKEYKLRVPRSR